MMHFSVVICTQQVTVTKVGIYISSDLQCTVCALPGNQTCDLDTESMARVSSTLVVITGESPSPPVSLPGQGDVCVLQAVPDHRLRGPLQHLDVPAAHLRGVLYPPGHGPALRSPQPSHHRHDHRGHCGRHDAVGHRLQRCVTHQPRHGEPP